MLPFFFLSDFTQNVMQIPQIAIVSDFAGEYQASAQMLRVIVGALFGQIFSSLAAIYEPTTSIEKMHIFFFVIDVASFIFHFICYMAADEKRLEKSDSKGCSFISALCRDTYKGLKYMPKNILGLGICFVFAAYTTAANIRYMQLTGQLTYNGVATGSNTCGTNCTEEQIRFNEGVATAALIIAIAGWISFASLFVLFVTIETLVKRIGVGILYTVALVLLSTSAAVPFVNIYISGAIQVLLTLAHTLVWQLPPVAIAVHCYHNRSDRISLYNASLNALGNVGQIFCGIVNTFISSYTYLGFGLNYIIGGGMCFFVTLIAWSIPRDDDVTEENKHLCFDPCRCCRAKTYK